VSATVKVKNTHLPECANCTRAYEKWCSFFEARMTCDRKQYLQQRREPFVDKPNTPICLKPDTRKIAK
jgi:hypothetical protein